MGEKHTSRRNRHSHHHSQESDDDFEQFFHFPHFVFRDPTDIFREFFGGLDPFEEMTFGLMGNHRCRRDREVQPRDSISALDAFMPPMHGMLSPFGLSGGSLGSFGRGLLGGSFGSLLGGGFQDMFEN